MLTDSARTRLIASLQSSARRSRVATAIVCRPENLETVSELVRDAGVDLQIATHPEAPGLYAYLRKDQLEEQYPGHVLVQTSTPVQERGARGGGEVRIIASPSETPQRLTMETGPEGVTVHLGD